MHSRTGQALHPDQQQQTSQYVVLTPSMHDTPLETYHQPQAASSQAAGHLGNMDDVVYQACMTADIMRWLVLLLVVHRKKQVR